MPHFAIIEAPSILRLKPTGVEKLHKSVDRRRFAEGPQRGICRIRATSVLQFKRDSETQILNPEGLIIYAPELAEAPDQSAEAKQIPRCAWRRLQ